MSSSSLVGREEGLEDRLLFLALLAHLVALVVRRGQRDLDARDAGVESFLVEPYHFVEVSEPGRVVDAPGSRGGFEFSFCSRPPSGQSCNNLVEDAAVDSVSLGRGGSTARLSRAIVRADALVVCKRLLQIVSGGRLGRFLGRQLALQGGELGLQFGDCILGSRMNSTAHVRLEEGENLLLAGEAPFYGNDLFEILVAERRGRVVVLGRLSPTA